MPKRGHRQPIQVRYEYPPSDRSGGKPVSGKIACYDAQEAASRASELSERGASGSVVVRDTGQVLATFHGAPSDQ